MPSITEEQLRERLGRIVDPHAGASLAETKAIRAVGIDGGKVAVEIQLGYPAREWRTRFAQDIKATLEADPAITQATVAVTTRIATHKVQGSLMPLPGVKNIIAVASGKGGVGKSTVAANLALALAAEGANCGILDADIYGPSQPRMLGVVGRPESPDGKSIIPLTNYELQIMSIGFLVAEDTPMVWRGPMVTQALTQLLNQTRWKDLDYLVVDMPPGTGDIQLTLTQRVPVAGAVIVTTPQDIALLDAKKGLKAFEKVQVPVLGIIENMATHICSNCGHEEHIFGAGGGPRLAEQYSVPFLGSLPLDIRIREQTDGGRPTVVAEPTSAIGEAYRSIARRPAARLARTGKDSSRLFPKIVVEDS
jgi:ATP-binding protein involved in chromosome partitioning